MATLQAKAGFYDVAQDPEFKSLPVTDQLFVMQKADKDFAGLEAPDQEFVRQKLVSRVGANPLSQFMTGLGNEFGQQASAGIIDRPEPMTGFEQAGSFGGSLLGGLANAGAGALAGGALGSVVPVIGNVAGAIGGGILGAAFGAGGRDVRAQMDEGKTLQNLNYGRTAITGLGAGAGQAIAPGSGSLARRAMMSALPQAGINAATDAGVQMTQGGITDPNSIMRSAAMGAGFGLMPGPKAVTQAMPTPVRAPMQAQVGNRQFTTGFRGQAPQLSAPYAEQQQVSRSIQTGLKQAMSADAIEPTASIKAKQKALNALYTKVAATVNHPNPLVAQTARQSMEQMRQLYQQLGSGTPQKPQAVKPTMQQMKQAVQAGLRARTGTKEQQVRFNQYLQKFSKEDRQLIQAKITDVSTGQKKKAQQQVERQAIRKEMAKEKIAELKQQHKATQPKPEAKLVTPSPVKKLAPPTGEVGKLMKASAAKGHTLVKDKQGIIKAINDAHASGKKLIVVYQAEGGQSGKGGESNNANFQWKIDTIVEPVATSKAGHMQVRVITAEGQPAWRKIDDPIKPGQTAASKILAVHPTSEKVKFRLDAETKQVLNDKGEVVPQDLNRGGTFSSQIQAALDEVDTVKDKIADRNVTVGEINRSLKNLSGTLKDYSSNKADIKTVAQQSAKVPDKMQAKMIDAATVDTPIPGKKGKAAKRITGEATGGNCP